MQVIRHKVAIYRAIANFEEQVNLKKGDKVHRPYRSALTVNAVGTGGSYTRQDITDTDESLTVDQEYEVSFYAKDATLIQTNYKEANHYADDASEKLTAWIDGVVFGQYDQADSIVANYEMGGGGSASDGIGFTLTTSNVLNVFGKANKAMDRLNLSRKNRWGAISGEFFDILWQFIAGKDSALGDSTGKNGHIGSYGGFQLFLSNNLGWSARLEFGTNPTDGDTITINGVALTWKATLGTTAGNIHICSDAAHSLDNLVASINAPGTNVAEATDAGFRAVSAANQKLLKGITATDGATYMTLKGEGWGYCVVSETLTAAADIWTTTKQLQHCLFGQGRPIDVVVQKYPKLEIKDRSGYIGKDFVTWMLYGVKTFDEGDAQLVDVQIRSDAF